MKRGFGSPNYDRRTARAAQKAGNRKLRETGQIHKWTKETAYEAGVKGVQVRTQPKEAA